MGAEITLAPAAGQGIGRKLADVLLAEPKFIPLLGAAFLDALQAEQFFYDKHAKEWHGEPDFKTRLAAAMGVLAQMEGEPVKRIIHQHLDASGLAEEALEQAAETSPALRRRLERIVQRAEKAEPKQVGPAKVESVDIDP
jgi:hypothetical protein